MLKRPKFVFDNAELLARLYVMRVKKGMEKHMGTEGMSTKAVIEKIEQMLALIV